MPKLSVAAWNLRRFHEDSTSKPKVKDHLKSMDPDIFPLLEVEGRDVWRYL